MFISNTNNFSLQNVVNILTGLTGITSLSSCLAQANNLLFDDTYRGSKNRLSNFRNYGVFYQTISATTEPDYFHFGIIDKNPVTGKYLGLHRLGDTHVDNSGMMVKTTSDDGITWTLDPTPVVDWVSPNYDVRNYGGGYTSFGRFYCFYSIYNAPTIWLRLDMIYSDDDGVTWSTGVTIQTYSNPLTINSTFCTFKMIELSNGDLLQPYHAWVSSVIGIGYLRSTDSGATWNHEWIISTGTVYTYAEPSIVRISGDTLLCVTRKVLANYNTTYHQFYSTNNGANWTDQGDTVFETWAAPGSGRERPCTINLITYSGKTIVACYFVNTSTQKFKVIYGNAKNIVTSGVTMWNTETLYEIKQLEAYPGFDFTRDGYQTIVHVDNEWGGLGQIYIEHANNTGKSDLTYFWTPVSNASDVLSKLE